MQDTEFKKANKDELRSLFGYLEFCLTQIVKDNELGALEQVCSDLKGLLCSGLLCRATSDRHASSKGHHKPVHLSIQHKVHWHFAE